MVETEKIILLFVVHTLAHWHNSGSRAAVPAVDACVEMAYAPPHHSAHNNNSFEYYLMRNKNGVRLHCVDTLLNYLAVLHVYCKWFRSVASRTHKKQRDESFALLDAQRCEYFSRIFSSYIWPFPQQSTQHIANGRSASYYYYYYDYTIFGFRSYRFFLCAAHTRVNSDRTKNNYYAFDNH